MTVRELTIPAVIDNIDAVIDFVNEQLEIYDCPMKAQTQIDIVIDELFGNIAQYAYNPEVGQATVKVEVIEDPMEVVITFLDNGMPYDPLSAEDPDVNAAIEDRGVGGLGIFMVKNMMDSVTYEYRDGQNILKIAKAI